MSHKLGSKIKVEKQYNNAISVSNVFLKPTLMNYEHDLDYCQKNYYLQNYNQSNKYKIALIFHNTMPSSKEYVVNQFIISGELTT